MTVTSALDGRGGTWNIDGTILSAPETQTPVYRVSTGGMLGGPVTTVDSARLAETTHRFPSFLPDGRHFLYVHGSHTANNQDTVNSIWVGDLESEETFELMQSGTQATYAQGHIFWVRDQFLMARPFSVQTLKFTGEAFAVGEGVVVQLDTWRAAYAVSEAGPLSFQSGLAAERILTLFDREGKALGTIGEAAMYSEIRLSPGGNWIAYLSNEAGKYDLFLTRFPGGEGKWQLSKDGASWLLAWNDAGTELFSLDLEGNLASVKVKFGDHVLADLPTILYSTRAGSAWDNKADGSGFVLGVPNDTGDDFPITLIVNWDGGGQTD